MDMKMDLHEEFSSIIVTSPLLRPILEQWEKLALPDCWLAAGAIAQTVWNRKFDLPPIHGISDLDLVYFDRVDLTERGEAQQAERIRTAFSNLPVWIDVKNEARVHTWYEAKFGYQISPYLSTADAITTFPTTATAIAVRPLKDSLLVEAPFGIDDLMNGVVRPNKKQITRKIYQAKAARWTAVWPGLSVVPWDHKNCK